jgi:hypothetical protein
VQQAQVVVGVVEDDLDVRVLDDLPEKGRRGDRQRIDDRVRSRVESCSR